MQEVCIEEQEVFRNLPQVKKLYENCFPAQNVIVPLSGLKISHGTLDLQNHHQNSPYGVVWSLPTLAASPIHNTHSQCPALQAELLYLPLSCAFAQLKPMVRGPSPLSGFLLWPILAWNISFSSPPLCLFRPKKIFFLETPYGDPFGSYMWRFLRERSLYCCVCDTWEEVSPFIPRHL